MSKYIDVEELSNDSGRFPKYPYAKWAREIPAGKALEIDADGQSPIRLQQTLSNHFKRHPELRLRSLVRKGHIYVTKTEAEA